MDAYIELQSTASASVQTSSTHTRAAPDERGALDVLGNPVVLYYPRCSEAPSLSPWNATTRTSWREMLDVDPPVGLSECEQRQWRLRGGIGDPVVRYPADLRPSPFGRSSSTPR
jgi:hypothetical protein